VAELQLAVDADRCWYTRPSWKAGHTVRCLLAPHPAGEGHLIDEVGGQRVLEWPEAEWDVPGSPVPLPTKGPMWRPR
jgi:hypothetical protein